MNIENMKCSLCNEIHSSSYCSNYIYNLYNKWSMNTVKDSKINYSIKDDKLIIFIDNLIVTHYNNYYYVYNNNKQLIFNSYSDLSKYLLEHDNTIDIEKVDKIIKKNMKGGTHLVVKALAGKALEMAKKQLPTLLKKILKPLLKKLLHKKFVDLLDKIDKVLKTDSEKELLGFLLYILLNKQKTTQELAEQLKEWNRPGIEGAVKVLINNSNINKIKIEILKGINKTALNNIIKKVINKFEDDPEQLIVLFNLLKNITTSITKTNIVKTNANFKNKMGRLKYALKKLSEPTNRQDILNTYYEDLASKVIQSIHKVFEYEVDETGKVKGVDSPIIEKDGMGFGIFGGMLGIGDDMTDSEKLSTIINNQTEYITTWLLIKLFDNTINMSIFTEDLYSELVLDDKLKLTKQDMLNTMNRTELRMVHFVSEVLDINELDKLFYNTSDDVVFLNEEDEMELYSNISSIVEKIAIHLDNCCDKIKEKREKFIELNTNEIIASSPDLQRILDTQFNLSSLVCYSNDNVSKTNAVILLFLYLRHNIQNTTELSLLNELYSVDLDVLDTIIYEGDKPTKDSIIRTIKTTLLHNDKDISNRALDFVIDTISDFINISKLKKIHLIDGELLETTNLYMQHILDEATETLDIRKSNLNIKTTLELSEMDEKVNAIFSSKYYKESKVNRTTLKTSLDISNNAELEKLNKDKEKLKQKHESLKNKENELTNEKNKLQRLIDNETDEIKKKEIKKTHDIVTLELKNLEKEEKDIKENIENIKKGIGSQVGGLPKHAKPTTETTNKNINRLIRYGILKAKLLLIKKQRDWIYKNKHIFDVVIHFIISYYKNKEAPDFSESIKDILDNIDNDDNEIIKETRSSYKEAIDKVLASDVSYIVDSDELIEQINMLLSKREYIERIGYKDSIPKLEALRDKIAEKMQVEKNVDTLHTKKRVIERDNQRMRQEKVLADDFDKLSKDKDQKKHKDEYLTIIKLFQRVIALYVFYKYTTMQLEVFDKIIDKTIEHFSQDITKNIGSVEIFKTAKQKREHMFNSAIELLENNNNYIIDSLNNRLFNINKSDSIERVNLNEYIQEFKKLTDTGLLTKGWRKLFGTDLQNNLIKLNNEIQTFKQKMDKLREAKSNKNNGANIISSLNNHIKLIKFTYKISEKLVNIYYNTGSKTTVDKNTKKDYSSFVKTHEKKLTTIEEQTKKKGWIYSDDTPMSKRIKNLMIIAKKTESILDNPTDLKDQLSTNIVEIDSILRQFLDEYKSDIAKLTTELSLVDNFESNVKEVKTLCKTIEDRQSFLKCNPTTSNFDIPDSRINIDTVTFSDSSDIDTFFSKEKSTILDSLNLPVELLSGGGGITFLPEGNVDKNLDNIIESLMLLFQDNKSLNIEAFDVREQPFFILKPFENTDTTDYGYTLLTDTDFVNKSFSQLGSKEKSIKLIRNLIDYLTEKAVIKDIDLFSEELLFYYRIPEDISQVNYWVLEIDESKKELLEVFKSTLKQKIRADYKTTLRSAFDELNDELTRTLEEHNISLNMRMEQIRKEKEKNSKQVAEIKVSESDVDFSTEEKNKIEFLNSKYKNIKSSKFKHMKKAFNNKIKYINNNALFDYLINLYITKKKTIPIDINSKLIEARKSYDADLKQINTLLEQNISNESTEQTQNDLFNFIKEFSNTSNSTRDNSINVNTGNIASIVSQFQLRDYLKKNNYFKIVVAYSNLDDKHKELNKIERMNNLPLTIKPRIIKTVYDLLIKSNTSGVYEEEEEDYDNYQPSAPTSKEPNSMVVLDMFKSKDKEPASKEPNSMVVFDSQYNRQSSFNTGPNSEIVTIADGDERSIRITN